MNIDLSIISKYRGELMGISAILILCVHAVGNKVSMPHFICSVLTLGQLGVDMFLILSGIGMYYSLSNWNGRIVDWYKRRFIRLLLPYFGIAIPYYLFLLISNQIDLPSAIFSISTLSFWFRHDASWFIALLIPLYLITPLLRKLPNREYGIWTVLCGIIALSVSFRFMDGGVISLEMLPLCHIMSLLILLAMALHLMLSKVRL